MRILAVIPARGGSKGIPRKNLVVIGDKPLIEHSIDAAINCPKINKLIVSTDDNTIAEVARKNKVDVPFIRPSCLGSDQASSWSVMKHAAEFFESRNVQFDAFLMLQPTTPLRPASLIEESINLLEENPQATSVVSLVDVGANHPHRMYKIVDNSQMKPAIEGDFDPMQARQSLPKYYIRSGDIYLTTRNTLFLQKSLIGNHPLGITIDPDRAINIDTMADLIVAENLLATGFDNQ